MATHSSLLAWEIPWTEGPGWLPSTGLQWFRHNWSFLAHTHIVYIRVCSLCCIFYRFDKCIMSPIHRYSRIGLPPENPHHPFPHPLATTDILMSPEFCLSQNVIEWGSYHSWTARCLFRLASFTDKQASEFPLCLLVGWQLISFRHWIVFCHLDMWFFVYIFTSWRATLVASSLGLLWKKVAIIFIHRFLWECKLSTQLGKYQRV